MPSFLANKFTTVGGNAYNFEYILLPTERFGAIEVPWQSFYVAAPEWDPKFKPPSDWLRIHMFPGQNITYRPIQPFDLSQDPVGKYVTFSDYKPADKRSRFQKLRTLRELTPGCWPSNPTPDQTLIATQLDLKAIAQAAEEKETERELLQQLDDSSSNTATSPTVNLTVADKLTSSNNPPPPPAEANAKVAVATASSTTTTTTAEDSHNGGNNSLNDLAIILEKTLTATLTKLVTTTTAVLNPTPAVKVPDVEVQPAVKVNNKKKATSTLAQESAMEKRIREKLHAQLTEQFRQSYQSNPDSSSSSSNGKSRRRDGNQTNNVQRDQLTALRQQQQQMQSQLARQQRQLSELNKSKNRPAPHSTFHLPGPEPARLLPVPVPKRSANMPAPFGLGNNRNKRQQFSPAANSPPEQKRKAMKPSSNALQQQHQLWLQFQQEQRRRAKYAGSSQTDDRFTVDGLTSIDGVNPLSDDYC